MGGDCLDDNEVAELLAGTLDAGRRAQAEVHLDGCVACRTLVADLGALSAQARTPGPIPGPPPVDSDQSAGMLAVGQRVDHFEVLGLLGHGGMGDVYAARDTNLDRTIALKVVRPELLGSVEALARFEREARATARFNHPNIITIHAVGEYGGRPYLALERLEGQTLAQRLRVGALPGPEALRIGLAVADGLVEAHAHGVLHRDLKPDNVHIDARGHVRVLDFGLAKLISGEEPTIASEPGASAGIDVFQTRVGGVSGTPTAMAPEQWRGQGEAEATDVWALGVILFTMLGGRRPLTGATVDALAEEALSREPVVGVQAIAPTIPDAWAELVAACLQKDASRRPSPVEVSGTLRREIFASSATPSAGAGRPRVAMMVAVGLAVFGGGWWMLAGGQASGPPSSSVDTVEVPAAPVLVPTPEFAEPAPEFAVPAQEFTEAVVEPPAPDLPAAAPHEAVAEPSPSPTAPSSPTRTRRPAAPSKRALFGTRE